MPLFKRYDTSQNLLLPINLAKQLVSGTFEHTLNYLVDHETDTSIFHEHYNNEQTGRLAYDPAMLLKVVLFAYSRGITSSRKIEKACRENLVFMALSQTANRTLRRLPTLSAVCLDLSGSYSCRY